MYYGHPSTRFGRGSHDKDALGDDVEAGLPVVSVTFWISFLPFGVVGGFPSVPTCCNHGLACLFVSLFHILPLPWL